MRWKRLAEALVLITLIAMAVQAVQAADEPAELKGDVVAIQDIVKNEPAYEGQNVVIEGKIDMECASGCWFILNDGSASLYVNILPSNFVIPQKSGSNAKVYGKVTTKNGDPTMIGKIVEIDGEIYR
ncbi:MAG: hypothetical protein EHM14_14265 [Methanothrix sp.]|nr:MAG: hypothetical protein EHM14_14265 [Methanothrix sp.]